MNRNWKIRIAAVFTSAAVILFFISAAYALCGCLSFSVGSCPYTVEGEMFLGPSSMYETAGFDFSFCNYSEKRIVNFTVVSAVFDADGEPPFAGSDYIECSFDCIIEPYGTEDFSINLDNYIEETPEEPYQTDYIYVSRIEYEDGSVWKDPFGRASM